MGAPDHLNPRQRFIQQDVADAPSTSFDHPARAPLSFRHAFGSSITGLAGM
ncbi:hypothetical protein [Nonomuraea sp. 10N515B]|uniref:hypothetical protein n=1 Tax=Nonomuraea sp. 10N515B TaxID=3457422 RepID=UPI003FCD3DAB